MAIAPRGAAYAELHCHSYFSLLAASSSPEELAERAAQLGLAGIALTDTGSLAGAIRFDQACKKHGARGIIGAAVSVLAEGAGEADDVGDDEQIAGQPGPPDHVELVGELGPGARVAG